MYVIAGVTGRTGGAAAERLLGAGQPVRVIVRDAAKGRAWGERGAQVAVASLDDVDSLTTALTGASGAYLMYPASPASPDPIGDGWRTADAIARAVDRSNLPHLVFLSALGAANSETTGIIRSLHAAEVRLASVRAALTFIRATYFLDEWLPVLDAARAGQLPTFLRPERSVPMVASRDVGALAARLLIEGPGASGREVVRLTGPHDPSPQQLAADLTALLGRPVAPAFAPDEAVVPTLLAHGASPAFAEQIRLLYQWINTTDALAANDQGRHLRGETDARTLFRDHLASAARPA